MTKAKTKAKTERRFEVTIVGDPCTYNVAARDANEARAIALLYLVSDRWTIIDTVREVK